MIARVPIVGWIVAALFAVAATLAVASLMQARAPITTQQAPAIAKVNLPPPPPIEPLELAEVTREDALAINDAVPFSRAPNPAARPFVLKPDAPNYARSLDCLAVAMLYEAGSADPEGERAVAQVVLNRLRHPAFPKTVCGVVFQGQERSTGCQFTFTCDGALAHGPPDANWQAARKLAAQMLAGRVFKAVGYATHYHTNWVVPYWSATLDKIAAVDTHLFFRWTGWWGTPGAFRGGIEGEEPIIAKIAALSPAHRAEPAIDGKALGIAALAMLPASKPKKLSTVSMAGDTFLVVLDAKASPDSYPALALATCADKPFCKFMGWADAKAAPTTLPMTDAQIAGQSFSYLRNQANGFEKMLWNCRQYKRADKAQCMKG